MNAQYRFRRAQSPEDADKLHDLYAEVFHPEEVGILAKTFFNHLPGMEKRNWFMVEEIATSRLVAALALIPWTWEMEGIRCKVAEMGIVGSLKGHGGQGLQRLLNEEFDNGLEQEGYDLAVIQGIPGFYSQFGYAYAVPLENQINLPLYAIPDREGEEDTIYRLAVEADIPFLMQEDARYREATAISAFRDEAHWRYLLAESQATEYGSQFWVAEHKYREGKFYCRIPEQGFGSGLIVSEISQDMTAAAMSSLFVHCKQLAVERQKPYIRLNLPDESDLGRMAIAMGAKPGEPYAWQIKFPNPARFLTTIGPLLERRLQESPFSRFSECFRLDFFRQSVDLVWREGRLESVKAGKGKCEHSFSISADLFPALALGHRTWRELRSIRPDLFPSSESSALFVETLFPSRSGWIYEQY